MHPQDRDGRVPQLGLQHIHHTRYKVRSQWPPLLLSSVTLVSGLVGAYQGFDHPT